MQLSIEVPVSNQSLLDKAKKEYESSNLTPRYLVANTTTCTYFVSYFFSKEHIQKYSNFLIIM